LLVSWKNPQNTTLFPLRLHTPSCTPLNLKVWFFCRNTFNLPTNQSSSQLLSWLDLNFSFLCIRNKESNQKFPIFINQRNDWNLEEGCLEFLLIDCQDWEVRLFFHKFWR
jgi:hypothetical protein